MSSTLNLSKDVYPQSCLEMAQTAYNDIATIEITESRRYWQCNFSSCVADDQITMQEFENYCIGLTNSKTGP